VYVDLRQKRSKRGKVGLLALTALMAHLLGQKMASYLDIARQVVAQLRGVDPPQEQRHDDRAEQPDPFADWVRRPDCHGRMGWEAPDLADWQRWWGRFDFDGLPEVPEGFCLGETAKPAPEDCAPCVPAGVVDTKHLGDNRPVQEHFRGFGRV